MAVRFFSGFETGDASEIVTLGSGCSIQTAVNLGFGNYTLKQGSGVSTLFSGLSLSTFAIRFKLRLGANISSTQNLLLVRDTSNVLIFNVLQTGGSLLLSVSQSASIGLTSTFTSQSVLANVTYTVCMAFDKAAGGVVRLWLNGALVLDTTHSILANSVGRVDTVGLASPNECYWDDILVTDTTSLITGGSIIARQGVAGTPTYDGWTKNGGASSAADAWSETPFSATKNCSDIGINNAQTMLVGRFDQAGSANEGLGAIFRSDMTLNAVKTSMIAKIAIAGSTSMRRRVGGADTDIAKTLTTSDAYYEDIWSSLPSYTNLTDGTLEVGAINTGGVNVTIEDIWVQADYAVPYAFGVRYFSGWETGDHLEWPTTSGVTAVDTTATRITGGGYSSKWDPSLTAYDESKSGLSDLAGYKRFNFISTVAGASKVIPICQLLDSSLNIIGSVRLVTDGSGNNFLRLWNGVTTTQVGSDYAISTSTWYTIELQVQISPVSGVLELKVGTIASNITAVQATGSNLNTGTNYIDRVRIGSIVGAGGATGNFWLDDSILNDVTYQGVGFCIKRSARSGTPTYNAWTKSNGSTIDTVWVNTPYGATEAHDAIQNDAQTAIIRLFNVVPNSLSNNEGFGELNSTDTLNAAKTVVIAKGDGTATSLSIRRRIASANTDTSKTVTSSAAYYDDGIWSTAVTNLIAAAIEAGIVNTSPSGTVTVYNSWIMIDLQWNPQNPTGILHFAGLETGDFSEVQTLVGSPVVDTWSPYGGYSEKSRFTNSDYVQQHTTNGPSLNLSTAFFKGNFKTNATIASGTSVFQYVAWFGDPSAAIICGVVLRAASTSPQLYLQLNYGSSSTPGGIIQIGSNYVIQPNTVYCIELYRKAGINGTVELRVNGAVVAALIINLGNANVGYVQYGTSAGSVTAAGSVWWDDIVIRADQYHGNSYCITRQGIAGTSTYDAWTKNGLSTAALCLSETPFSTTNNVSTTTASTPQQSMLLGSFGSAGSAQEGSGILASTDTINAAKTAMIAKSSFSTAKALQILRRLNGVDTLTSKTVTASDAYYDDGIYAPTYTQLTSATTEIGVKNTGTGSGTAQVEDMWLIIDYTPTPRTLAPSGISSTEAFGGDMLRMNLVPVGVASAESFGASNITRLIRILGIISGEVFGLDNLVRDLLAISINSQESFGIDSVVRNVKTAGISSIETFGLSNLVRNLLIAGIGSEESFGVLLIVRVIRAIAIASIEAFGTGKIGLEALLNSIASAEAFGQLTALQAQIIRAAAIASNEVFGTLQLSRDINISSISSQEAFGIANTIAPLIAKTLGIPTQEAFGLAQLWFGAIVDEVRFILLDTYPPSRVSVEPYAVLDVGLSDAEIPIDVEFSNTYDVLDIEINAYPTVVVSFIEVPDMNVVLAGDTITIDFQVTNPYDGTLYDPNPAPVISIIDGFGAERVSRDSNVTRLSQGKYRYEYTTPTDTQAAGLYNARVQCNSPSGKPSGSLKVSAFRVIV